MAKSRAKKMKVMEVDRISALPDSVLCHILSFLPTAQSVATSSLSKRWTNLWRYVPSLRFSDADVERLSIAEAALRFGTFVYSVLLSQDSSQPIESFRLRTSRNLFDFFNLNKWIQFVLQRRVQLLALSIDTPLPLRMPHSIFSSKTLEILTLDGFYVKNFPVVALPALKVLHLIDIKFSHSRCLVEILAACPILEDFAAGCIECDNHDTITCKDFKNSSFAAKLVKSFVYQFDNIVFPLKVFSNVKYLCIDTTQVSGGNLEIPTFHNLTHLDLKYFDYQFDWDLIMKLLKNSPKLQFLVLSQPEKRIGVEPENQEEPELVPECLLSHLRTCTMEDFEGLLHEIQLANYIMKNAKVLRSMTIQREEKVSEGKVKMIKEVLSACPKGSATCQLSVC